MNHLLDTNAFVDHLRRGAKSRVTAKLLAAPTNTVYISSIVLAELFFGAIRSGPAKEPGNRAMIAGLMAQFPTIPFDDLAADEYSKIRAYLTATGKLIGPNDMLIAAVALANGMTLVTHNISEFSRVPGLVIEDWE